MVEISNITRARQSLEVARQELSAHPNPSYQCIREIINAIADLVLECERLDRVKDETAMFGSRTDD